MTDATAERKLTVTKDAIAGPYLIAPFSELERIKAILDTQKIVYWVDGKAISVDNKPFRIFINFGRHGDAERIQAVLDAAN